MPVPASISELATAASSNSPAGTESPITADDYLRNHAAFIAQLRDKSNDLANSTDPLKGATGVGFLQDGPNPLNKNVMLQLREIVRTGDFLAGDEANSSTKLQGLVTHIAQSETRIGRRELVVNRKHTLGSVIDLPSDFRLIFEDGAELIPGSDFLPALRAYGALPTTYSALTADMLQGSDRALVASTAPFSVGGYVWFNDSTAIITSPNVNSVVQGQLAQVVAVEAGAIVLDRPAQYTYSAATTSVGVMSCKTGIRIEGFRYGKASNTFRSGVGLDLRYCDNLTLRDIETGYSRTAPSNEETLDVENRNGVLLRSACNVRVDGIRGRQIAWYLMSLDGACHNVAVRNLECQYARHGISTNWNGPGEPIDVLVEKVVTDSTTFGGIDTHDVGRDITFRDIKCRRAKNDGMQIRTSRVRLENAVAENCGGSGLVIRCETGTDAKRLTNVKLEGVRYTDNGKRGISSAVPFDAYDVTCMRNGASYSLADHGGISTSGGTIRKARIEDNNGPAITYAGFSVQSDAIKPLTLDDATAPASAKQAVFMYSAQTYEGKGMRLRDVTATGYSTANLFMRNGSTYIADIEDKGCQWGSVQRRGVATLSSGTVTVSNDNARITAIGPRNWKSRIALQRQTQGAAPGELSVSVSDGASFTITSSSAADTGTVEWWFE